MGCKGNQPLQANRNNKYYATMYIIYFLVFSLQKEVDGSNYIRDAV